jgi:outer membrane protein assembly factor BamB
MLALRRLSLALASLLLAVVGIAAEPSPFEGVWTGEIVAPNTKADFGLAFTATEKGLLVSLDFPAMFLHSVNFGPAEVHGDRFALPPLNLVLDRNGDSLDGTFAIAKLPVHLHRGGTFAPAPAPTEWPAAPAPVWSHSLGAGAWASPIAYAGVLYVGTIDGKFHAIRAADGTELWAWSGPNPLYGTALATDDAVYFVDEHTDLVRLDRTTGELVWRLPLHDEKLAGGPPPKNETFNHRATSPVYDPKKGLLFVGSTDGGLYAIRVRTGRVAWRHALPAKVYAPVTLDGDEAVVACFDGSVLALNRRTQAETLHAKLGGGLVSAPVVAGQRIVIGARDYLLYGLDRTDAKVAWRDSYWFSWIESTPSLVDGTLYIGGSDFRRISALEAASGRTLWSTDVLGLTWGTPAVGSTMVFACTAGQNIEGTVIHHSGGLVALDRATGAPKWRYVSPAPAGASFVGFAGSPVLIEGKVVGAAVDGTLLALPAE